MKTQKEKIALYILKQWGKLYFTLNRRDPRYIIILWAMKNTDRKTAFRILTGGKA